MKVGSLVKLIVPCLGNGSGVIGVVYECYNLGGHKGTSVMFPNGQYDGFSEAEQETFLKEVGFCKDVQYYKFSNVIRLSDDFRDGYFNKAFKEGENL